MEFNSLEEIENAYKKNGVSLGIFKPKIVEDLIMEADDEEWSDTHKKILSQLVLFGEQPKPLFKIPYKFSYVYQCNDEQCTRFHKQAIFDWEIFNAVPTSSKPIQLQHGCGASKNQRLMAH